MLRFAADLRRLRAEAGSPTYRDLGARTHYSAASLSEAAAGRKLPSLPVALAYVKACGGNDAEWEQRWRALVAELSAEAGVHEAHVRNQAAQIRDADTANAARDAKRRAAAVNLVVATPELLIQTDRDFVYVMWERASGPRVKSAARAAFEGTADGLREFIETGIFRARAQDQRDRIEADERTGREEKAALAAKDARTRAAAVLGILVTPAMLIEPEDNFVLDLWDRAAPGTEVAAAAEAALRDPEPGALRRFIETGIFGANRRDRDNRLKKKIGADRLRAFEPRTHADNGKVHPALVAAHWH
ncbi:hypothetical protein GCM10023192_80010 [Amycolatopsis samaneae]